tara:strand:- start:45 stop:398 length:354 start_codon:yes stop_codon:yes gene_type:complete
MDYSINQGFNNMIGLIKKLQDKGQAKQDQTDALVDFIQDELSIDAMRKVGQVLAPVLAPAMPMTLQPSASQPMQKPMMVEPQMQGNQVLNMLSSNKAMDMMNKNQTMNPTILKARGM